MQALKIGVFHEVKVISHTGPTHCWPSLLMIGIIRYHTQVYSYNTTIIIIKKRKIICVHVVIKTWETSIFLINKQGCGDTADKSQGS